MSPAWGVVAALSTELRPTLRLLRAARESNRFRRAGPFVFVAAGVGSSRAEAAALELGRRYRPSVLVSTGFAGALTPELATGDVVVGGDVGRLPPGLGIPGAAVCADRVLNDALERAQASARGSVVDMESAGVARAAKQLGCAFLTVKAVLDTPDRPLASRYESVHAVVGQILLRPSTLKAIFADARRAGEAARALAAFYQKLAAALAT